MSTSTRLRDYVSVYDWLDVNHSLFPGYDHHLLQDDIRRLADMMVPPLGKLIEEHLNAVPVPKPSDPPSTIRILPSHFSALVADMLDYYRPGWNVAQKTVFYFYYMTECLKAAWEYRRQQQQESNKGEPMAIRIDGSLDPGEFKAIIPDNIKNN